MVVVLFVIPAAYLGLVWYPSSVTYSVGCGSWNPDFDYQGNASGYLFVLQNPGVSPIAQNTTCEHVALLKTAPGSHLPDDTILKNAQLHDPHEIVSLAVSAPWGLVSVTPSLPVTIPAGGNVSFSMVISAPTTPGSYAYPGGSVVTM